MQGFGNGPKTWHTSILLVLALVTMSTAGLGFASPKNQVSAQAHSHLPTVLFGGLQRHTRRQPGFRLAAAHAPAPPAVNCRVITCFALTFDDGPSAVTTPQILHTLESYHVPASFFVIGDRVNGNQALLARMHADGDEVQSHTWTHPNLTTLSPAQISLQFDLSALAIEDSGAPAPTLLRPPYGAVNSTVINTLPVPLAMWNEDPKDWQKTDPNLVAQTVINDAKPGGVVDLHDIYQSTADAVPTIIQNLSARGFHFVTFSQLTVPVPDSHQEYFGLKP